MAKAKHKQKQKNNITEYFFLPLLAVAVYRTSFKTYDARAGDTCFSRPDEQSVREPSSGTRHAVI